MGSLVQDILTDGQATIKVFSPNKNISFIESISKEALRKARRFPNLSVKASRSVMLYTGNSLGISISSKDA
jgi:hypothetical protein